MPYANPETAREYQRTYERKRHAANPEYRRELQRRWDRKNPERYLWLAAKARAKKYGLAFSIAWQDIHIPERCPVLGLVLEFEPTRGIGTGRNGGRSARDNAPSLDRIDHARGYETGNVRVISWRANSLKKNGTLAEFEAIVADMCKDK